MKKKIFISAFFLFFFLIISGKVDARSTISQLRSKYPSGSIYSQGPYTYAGVTYDDNGNQVIFDHTDKECSGFAATMYREYFGVDREWGTKITDKAGISNITPGDIVRNNKHSVFVLSRNGNYVTVAEANYGSTYNMINWDRSININEFYNNFEYIYKAYFPFDNPNSAPAVEIPTNITASYNGSTNRLTINWKQVKKASGYKIRIYKKSDVENNNWSNPVFEKIDNSNSSGPRFYDFSTNGEFYVFVVTILDEFYATNGGTPAEFNRIEAQYVSIQNKPIGDIYIGENFQLKSLITPTNANTGNKVTWSSSNSDVASITSSSGYVTPKAEGNVTITVKTANNKTDKCTFNVKQRINVQSITLDKTELGMQVGDNYILNATITPSNSTDSTVIWESSNENVATIDGNGNIKAVKAGETTITAKTSNNKTATCKITVFNSDVKAEFSKDIIIARFSSVNLLDYIKSSDNSSINTNILKLKVLSGKENTYSIEGTKVIFDDSINSFDNELYEIEMEYLGSRDTIKIRKTAKTVTGMQVSFKNDSELKALHQGDTFVTHIYPPTYGDNTSIIYVGYLDLKLNYNPDHFEIIYASSDLENSYINDDKKGTIQVKADYNGDIRNVAGLNFLDITFKVKANDNISDIMSFKEIYYRQYGTDYEIKKMNVTTVNNYYITKVLPIEAVSITNKKDSMPIGYVYKLYAKYSPEDATGDKTVTWKSSNTNIATVDSKGTVNAKKVGSTTITATIGDKTDSVIINVYDSNIYIENVKITNFPEKLMIGDAGSVSAEVYPSNTTQPKDITFSSNNNSVISIEYTSGGTCYIKARGIGEATISALSSNGKSATCKIKVLPPITNIEVKSVNTSKTTVNLYEGDSELISASVSPSNATNKNITWSSSNSSIATVSNGKITGIKVGTTTIKATADNGVSKSITVVVKDKKNEEKVPSVEYRTHVQDYGWQGYVKDGSMAGTSGKSKRLEGINIRIKNSDYSGSIEYKTHVQNIGWQNYVSDDKMSGTQGRSLRLEAIQIRLTGEISDYYDVYYRVHCQNIGWMDWAKNDEKAGSAGYGYRLEGIEIVLVKKGENPPTRTNTNYKKAYKYTLIAYRTHVQDYGWQDYVIDKEESGTTGESKRLEAIQIFLTNPDHSGGIEYRTHVQDYGWQNYVTSNRISGTSGESKRLEAIQIRLTGEMADYYDVYYRVHCENIGWMGWAKNDEKAGTAGYSYRLEAIQIVLVKKGEQAPGNTNNAFKELINTSQPNQNVSSNKYVVNNRTKVFHRPTCGTLKNASPNNISTVYSSRDVLLENYRACKDCKP